MPRLGGKAVGWPKGTNQGINGRGGGILSKGRTTVGKKQLGTRYCRMCRTEGQAFTLPPAPDATYGFGRVWPEGPGVPAGFQLVLVLSLQGARQGMKVMLETAYRPAARRVVG